MKYFQNMLEFGTVDCFGQPAIGLRISIVGFSSVEEATRAADDLRETLNEHHGLNLEPIPDTLRSVQ